MFVSGRFLVGSLLVPCWFHVGSMLLVSVLIWVKITYFNQGSVFTWNNKKRLAIRESLESSFSLGQVHSQSFEVFFLGCPEAPSIDGDLVPVPDLFGILPNRFHKTIDEEAERLRLFENRRLKSFPVKLYESFGIH